VLGSQSAVQIAVALAEEIAYGCGELGITV
jgi:hypothetical protein